VTDIIRRKPSSFEEYWLASKAWERKGLPLGTARALVNAGFLTVDDLHTAHHLELATIPRVGLKSLAILYGLMGREMPEVGLQRGKAIPKDRSKFHHCSICGAVVSNEPKPVLRHQMSHVRRHPLAHP
jgi:hypothetical protein